MLYVCSFQQKKNIIEYFNKRCIDEGFNGLYVIETYTGDAGKHDLEMFSNNLSEHTGMVYFREPNVAMRKLLKQKPLVRLYFKIIRNMKINLADSLVLRINGSHLFKIMSKNIISEICGRFVSHGLFFSWDNTPRHGNKGYVITLPKRKEFNLYMNAIKDDEYIFINAWNEWAEGMIMEPTEEYGFRNLEWLSETISETI